MGRIVSIIAISSAGNGDFAPIAELTRQHGDALDVVGQRERVENPHLLHPVVVRTVQADIPGE
jgi:acetaldehyde dehydrogenase (acetylating)